MRAQEVLLAPYSSTRPSSSRRYERHMAQLVKLVLKGSTDVMAGLEDKSALLTPVVLWADGTVEA